MALFLKKNIEKEELQRKLDKEQEIKDLCEKIDNANLQIKLAKREYEEVNMFLQDAQLIDSMPEDDKEKLIENAKHLVSLRKDISDLSKQRTNLTEFEFGIIEKYEDIIPKEIERLKKEENYESLLREDLRTLAGEREVLKHAELEEFLKNKFLKSLSIVSSIVILILLIMYLIIFLVFNTYNEVAILITFFGSFIMGAYIFFEFEKNKKNIKLTMSKLNKLISLTNKIKAKYVNQKRSVDFSHDKYSISNVVELEYRYKKYVEYRENEIRRRKASSAYDFFNNKYIRILEAYKIHDSEVWSYQATSIIEPKEMVETRHRLNERRHKIRNRLSELAGIIEKSNMHLLKIAKEDEEIKELVKENINLYNLDSTVNLS